MKSRWNLLLLVAAAFGFAHHVDARSIAEAGEPCGYIRHGSKLFSYFLIFFLIILLTHDQKIVACVWGEYDTHLKIGPINV